MHIYMTGILIFVCCLAHLCRLSIKPYLTNHYCKFAVCICDVLMVQLDEFLPLRQVKMTAVSWVHFYNNTKRSTTKCSNWGKYANNSILEGQLILTISDLWYGPGMIARSLDINLWICRPRYVAELGSGQVRELGLIFILLTHLEG